MLCWRMRTPRPRWTTGERLHPCTRCASSKNSSSACTGEDQPDWWTHLPWRSALEYGQPRVAGNCRAAQEALEDAEDEELELSPEKGNVAFASAHDGWAFHTSQFAELYAAKLGFKAAALGRVLWGDYRIDPKTKKICRIRASHAAKYKPLFVQVRCRPEGVLSSLELFSLLVMWVSPELLMHKIAGATVLHTHHANLAQVSDRGSCMRSLLWSRSGRHMRHVSLGQRPRPS